MPSSDSLSRLKTNSSAGAAKLKVRISLAGSCSRIDEAVYPSFAATAFIPKLAPGSFRFESSCSHRRSFFPRGGRSERLLLAAS